MSSKHKILIIGIAGGLAQMTARLILTENPEWEIIGIDSRNISNVPPLKASLRLNLNIHVATSKIYFVPMNFKRFII